VSLRDSSIRGDLADTHRIGRVQTLMIRLPKSARRQTADRIHDPNKNSPEGQANFGKARLHAMPRRGVVGTLIPW
jgi:hypothetical protein